MTRVNRRFFEARNSPETAPLMLWLNGGPGGSSLAAGLLFENGPCTIAADGDGTVHNEFSWNEKVNIIYLDEPVGTGYSYASDDSIVSDLESLARDVWGFLQVFMYRFPEYATLPFHIAAESWGGHYGPHIASRIFKENVRIGHAPSRSEVKINLSSLVLANGLTEPATQFNSIPTYMCSVAPYPIFGPNDPRCLGLRGSSPACVEAIQSCYRTPDNHALCRSATYLCWYTQMTGAALGEIKVLISRLLRINVVVRSGKESLRPA